MKLDQVVGLVRMHHDVVGYKKHHAQELLSSKKAMGVFDILQFELS